MSLLTALRPPKRNLRRPAVRRRGFTLVEMLVALAIIGILTALALPSFKTLVQNQNVKAGAADLQTSLFYARSEALKRAVNVDVIPVGNDWQNGWTVQLPDATVLRAQRALNSALTSMPVASGARISYQSDGHVVTAPAAIVVKVAGNTRVTARCVVVDLSGRPRVRADTDGNPSNGCN